MDEGWGMGRGDGGKEDLEEDEGQISLTMPRNQILLQRLPTPERVQLPNGGESFAKYQRVGRHALTPTRVRISRTYIRNIRPRQQRIRKIGPRNKQRRRQQTGAGLDLSTVIAWVEKLQGLNSVK